VSLEQEAKIAAALLRAQAMPCSIFGDSKSCDNLGEPLPYDFGSGRCGLAPPHLRPGWKELFKRAADYRFLAAHRTREHRTYSELARNYEALAQEAVYQAVVDDDDVPDLGYWQGLGDADARAGYHERFHREESGTVRADGSFMRRHTEQFEHVAGEAYLMGYAAAIEDEGT
jgi:hypothetical protein